jgi:hypothetical protein
MALLLNHRLPACVVSQTGGVDVIDFVFSAHVLVVLRALAKYINSKYISKASDNE